MKQETSSDGTALAYERAGSGPPLLIIGGALADHRFYAPLASELAADFTVINFDRRGRGSSGNTQPYDIALEIDDVAALIGIEGQPVIVYGHSAGAALALQAGGAGVPMATLVLADPPYTARGIADAGSRASFAAELAEVEALHARGDFRDSARFFLGSLGVPEEQIDAILDSPMGAGMIDCARALLHDYLLLGDGLVPVTLARGITAPVVVLAADSSAEAAAQLVAALPDGELVRTERPAHETAPAEQARTLARALSAR